MQFPNCLDNKPFFYIYDWPPELGDVYPPKNATLHKSSTYDHSFNENGGAGRMLDPDVGLFQTWQASPADRPLLCPLLSLTLTLV